MTVARIGAGRGDGASGFAFVLLLALSFAAAPAFARIAKGAESLSPLLKPRVVGELWRVTTRQEIYGPRDKEPSKRDWQENLVCYPRGVVSMNSAANADLPAELKDKCWLSDQRSEPHRQQTKYACNDGMSAEVATRREVDGSFGSQVVVSIPEKGGIFVTRTMRRVPGGCDPSVKAPETPVQPVPPPAPAIEAPTQ